jgi:hypothetical protein
MVVVGVNSPQSRDTPTGSDIGSEAGFRKGFVIELTNDIWHNRPAVDRELTLTGSKAEGAQLAEFLIWSCSRATALVLRAVGHVFA